MRICFINILFAKTGESGGLGSHIRDLSRALSAIGHDVTVITSGNGSAQDHNGVKMVPMGRVDSYSSPAQLLNPLYILRRAAYMARMTRYVLNHGFDVVEFADGGLEQFLLAISRNCALVTKLHGNFRFAFAHGKLLSALIERLEGWAVRRSDGIYASTIGYSVAISQAYRIRRERIKVLPCAIDMSQILSSQGRNPTEKYPQLKDKTLVFASVGNSAIRKGAAVFLEAAGLLLTAPNLQFVLACEDARYLRSVAIPENVLTLSKLSQSDFYDWIRASQIVVFPSAAETFSIAMHEAMLLKKTIVISPFLPVESIDREYPRCLILQTLDGNSLSAAIHAIASGRQQFPEVSDELNQRMIQYYDTHRVARETENLYRDAVGRAAIHKGPARIFR